MRDPEIQKRIDELRDIFVKEFNPERVILFGSYARNEETETSSIDMLIIAQTTLSFYDRIKHAIRISRGDPPVEPLVYTPAELNALLQQGEGFIDNVLKEGILLYSK